MHKQNTRRGFLRNSVILNLFQDLHLRRGFTLIELLVVVLIIGILAAVAVPQYKIATDKARLANLLSMANAVSKAQEVYYLANGKYTVIWAELPLELPGKLGSNNTQGDMISSRDGWTAFLTPYSGVRMVDSHLPDIRLYHFYPHHSLTRYQNKQACYALATNRYANKLCQKLTNKSTSDEIADFGAQNVYILD